MCHWEKASAPLWFGSINFRRNICHHVQVPSPEEAWEHYEQLLQRLLGVCKLSGVSTWRQLQAFLRDFATKLPGAASGTSESCSVVALALTRRIFDTALHSGGQVGLHALDHAHVLPEDSRPQ